MHLRGEQWPGSPLHYDDILAVDYLPSGLVATASFDGEINVWTVEKEHLYVRLRKGHNRINYRQFNM